MKRVFKKAETRADTKERLVIDLSYVAVDVLRTLNDEAWARKIFLKAENNAEAATVLAELAGKISLHLDDKIWARKLFIKAEEQAVRSIDHICLAIEMKTVFRKEKKWVKRIYKKAAENVQSLGDLDNIFSGNFESEKWKAKLCLLALTHYFLWWAKKPYPDPEDVIECTASIPELVERSNFKFDNKVQVLYDKWFKSYVPAFIEYEFNYPQSHSDPLEGDLVDLKRQIVRQLDFIGYSINCTALNKAKGTLARIKRFLSMQKPDNGNNFIEIHFHSPIGSPEIFIESIDDIDIADSLSFLHHLDAICIYPKGRKKWSKSKAKSIFEGIVDDLKFEGYYPSLKYEIKSSSVTIEGKFK